MARELNCTGHALSRLSRGVESRTGKRPLLSDLRESGSIKQDADLVLMIYRDEYYKPDTPDRRVTEVIVTKHQAPQWADGNGQTALLPVPVHPIPQSCNMKTHKAASTNSRHHYKLNANLIEEVCHLVKYGATLEHIALAVGVSIGP